MTFFVLLIAFSRSFQNQVLVSGIAITYWVVGIALIYGKLNIALMYKKIKTYLLGIFALQKITAILGCLLFLCSAFLPFYHLSQYDGTLKQTYSIYYWSFKSSYPIYWSASYGDGQSTGLYRFVDYWFYDYWFHDPFLTEFRLSWVLIFMFVAQILTLATGIATILINKRILTLIPAILCSTVTVLMTYTNISLTELNLTLDSSQLGYWLTYPSLALFIVSFILKTKLD